MAPFLLISKPIVVCVIFFLTNLAYLLLDSNQINGSILLEIGNMKNLSFLSLFDNKLTGPIHSSLGHLTKLVSLYLDSNQINGSIMLEIGNIENFELPIPHQ